MPNYTFKLPILVVAALAATGLVGCNKGAEETDKAQVASHRVVSATVIKIASAQVARQMHVTGIQVAKEEASVSTQLSGYPVAQVLVEAGALVKAGQPLAQLDDVLLKSQAQQQKAIVDQQRIAYERASQEAQRVENLDTQGALSSETVKERALAARSAKAALDQAEAVLNDYSLRLGLMTIRAPVAGIILTRSVRPGDISSSGAAMFTMARDGLIELQADIPEADLSTVQVGTIVHVSVPSGKAFTGTVRLLSPKVDEETKLGTVRISLPIDPLLKPGGFGEATIDGVMRSASVVPVKAVNYDADGASIFVVDGKGITRRQAVKTGIVANGVVELIDGPPTGTTVVAKGTELILPGDQIRATLESGGEK